MNVFSEWARGSLQRALFPWWHAIPKIHVILDLLAPFDLVIFIRRISQSIYIILVDMTYNMKSYKLLKQVVCDCELRLGISLIFLCEKSPKGTFCIISSFTNVIPFIVFFQWQKTLVFFLINPWQLYFINTGRLIVTRPKNTWRFSS